MMRRLPSKATALLCRVSAASSRHAPIRKATPVPATRRSSRAAAAKGAMPAGLPARVLVGLFEDTGGDLDEEQRRAVGRALPLLHQGLGQQLGLRRLRRLVGPRRTCASATAQGFMPAVQYYQMIGEAGGGESAFLAKVQNATTMKGYFGDFKILMQRAKDFGKPVHDPDRGGRFRLPAAADRQQPAAYAAIEGQRRCPSWRDCPTPSPAGAWRSCSCASRWAPATPSSASTSRAGRAARTSPTVQRDRSALARGRQGLQLPRAVRPRRERHRARPATCWSAIRSIATPTTTG